MSKLRKFTFAVTVEAGNEQEAHDLIWQSLRKRALSKTSAMAGLRDAGYQGSLVVMNLLRSISKYQTREHHLALFKQRLIERNT